MYFWAKICLNSPTLAKKFWCWTLFYIFFDGISQKNKVRVLIWHLAQKDTPIQCNTIKGETWGKKLEHTQPETSSIFILKISVYWLDGGGGTDFFQPPCLQSGVIMRYALFMNKRGVTFWLHSCMGVGVKFFRVFARAGNHIFPARRCDVFTTAHSSHN